jgi:hypothetical protein
MQQRNEDGSRTAKKDDALNLVKKMNAYLVEPEEE